ncbi:pirin family protein [Pontiella sp.]|uniref:pirin family protein n=1 Tax=Pontiella sp. TaxID=2837462 RepID=UPI003563D31B
MRNTLKIRSAADRGVAEHGWLHSRFTFSFAGYFDPQHMGFRSLRVINDDIIEPGKGFGTHPHENMEIISYVVEGALEHKDSMGHGSVIRPGDIQRMSAGTGVTHSEFNPLRDRPVRLLQIWIKPDQMNVEPGYEEKPFPPETKTNRLRLVASPDGADGSVRLNADVRLYASILEPGTEQVKPGDGSRHVWIQVVNGKLSVDGEVLETGDGAAIEHAADLTFQGLEKSEFLVFDLA